MTSDTGWYHAKNGQTVGPMNLDELVASLPGIDGADTLVYGPATPEWTQAKHIAAIRDRLRGAGGPPPTPKTTIADEIDYEIFGDDMQFVEVTLDPNEVVVAEAGALLYMTHGIQMETVFGDPSKQTGVLGKLLDAGKRMVTGESLFLTTFAATGDRREQVSFAAPYPGKIIPMHLAALGGEVLCQKQSFLCAARGVTIDIAFQKKLGAGLFGGEGFILQRLRGDGLAFVHAGGTIVKRELAPGETLRVDTGCLVAFQPSVKYDITRAGGIKTMFFGGEGLFLASMTGPGSIWLQSLPFSRLAGRIAGSFSAAKGKGEGSILGGLGLGGIIGGGD